MGVATLLLSSVAFCRPSQLLGNLPIHARFGLLFLVMPNV
jgi:hypothetical protein